MSNEEQLARVTLFRGLDAESLAGVAALATPLSLAANLILVEEGTRNEALYLLLEGQLRVSLPASAQRRAPIFLRTAGPGEVLGEYSAFDSDMTSARVETETPCRLLHMSAENLRAFLRERPRAASVVYNNVIVTLIRRLRDKDAELEALLPF